MVELRKRSEVSAREAETRVSDRTAGEIGRDELIAIRAAGHSKQIDCASGDEGQTVKAVWGSQYYQVVQYNGFTVGPFEATTIVRAGETVARALLRLHEELEQAAAQIGRKKADEHVAELRRLGIGVR